MKAMSGKGPKRDATTWGTQVQNFCEDVDISWSAESRPAQAGKPCILRLGERDDNGVRVGGTAVLTLYSTGSWTWGGDADVVAYVREPLDTHGLLPAKSS